MTDPGMVDILAILTRLVSGMETINKRLETIESVITVKPPAPQPEPQQNTDSYDWSQHFLGDTWPEEWPADTWPEEWPADLPPLKEFDRSEICHRAWFGRSHSGAIGAAGEALEEARSLVRDVVEDPTLVEYGEVVSKTPRLKQAVDEYRAVLAGVSKRKELAIALDADLPNAAALDKAYTAHVAWLCASANIEPDAAWVLLLTGEIDPLHPEPIFGVIGSRSVLRHRDMTLEALWERDQNVGGGTPSGRL